MLLWHLLFIAVTVIFVQSGFDWFYFSSTRSPVLREWMFPSAPIGGLVPLALPLLLILSGFVTNQARISRTGWAVGQAALIGSLLSSSYKAFTGRVHPEHFIEILFASGGLAGQSGMIKPTSGGHPSGCRPQTGGIKTG
jgi:hypothetical protein